MVLTTARGHIDSIAYLDARSGGPAGAATSVPFGALLTVYGWAALLDDPGGATGAFAMLDDGPPIEIVYGIARPDVAEAMRDERFAMTGFRGALSTSHLSLGTHRLRVALRDGTGTFVSFEQDAMFEIVQTIEQRIATEPASQAATQIELDVIAVGDVVRLRGWAIDEPEHALATAVYAIAGSAVFQASYGEERPDVAGRYADERLRKCGFVLEIPLDELSPGSQTIALRVLGSGGHTIYDGPRLPLQVAPFATAEALSPVGLPTLGSIDQVRAFDALGNLVDTNAPITLARGNQLLISGWVIDEPGDALARAVHVCIDGIASTVAVYGLERRDVARHFQRPDLAPCGFSALVATASMPPGPHTAVVRIIDRTGSRFYELERRVEFEIEDASEF